MCEIEQPTENDDEQVINDDSDDDEQVVRNLPTVPQILLQLRDIRYWGRKFGEDQVLSGAAQLEDVFQKHMSRATDSKQTKVVDFYLKKM